jgi:hypothetical protein
LRPQRQLLVHAMVSLNRTFKRPSGCTRFWVCESGKQDADISKPPVIDFIVKMVGAQRARSEELYTILEQWKVSVIKWSCNANKFATVAEIHFPLWLTVENQVT